MTFSCSAAIVNHIDRTGGDRRRGSSGGGGGALQQQYFGVLIQEAARLARRNVTVVKELGASSDHPVHIANPQSK